MAVQLTLKKKNVDSSGRIVFDFDDGTSLEFSSQADVDNYVNAQSIEAYMPEQLKRYLMGWSGRNGAAVNKTATFDIDSPAGNIVRIQ